jgi:hypothetical protein
VTIYSDDDPRVVQLREDHASVRFWTGEADRALAAYDAGRGSLDNVEFCERQARLANDRLWASLRAFKSEHPSVDT